MPLRPEALAARLDDGLAPVYLLTGDEPLLIQECADRIRTAARAAGFTERKVYHADGRSFDWAEPLAEASALSLFAERKMIEIRLTGDKPGEQGGAVLVELCQLAGPDLLILVTGPQLDRKTTSAAWVRACDRAGSWVQVWPVKPAELPRWIAQRLQQIGIAASPPAVEVLAQRVEGNLLAAAQEIEKLRLLVGPGQLDAETVSTVVADSARFNLFDLVDRALAGDTQGTIRSLRGLREEGVEPAVIVWALARDLPILARARQQGGPGIERTLADLRVWEKRRPLFRAAAARIGAAQADLLLRQLGAVDRAIKGVQASAPWQGLEDIFLSLCGRNAIHPVNLRLGLDSPLW